MNPQTQVVNRSDLLPGSAYAHGNIFESLHVFVEVMDVYTSWQISIVTCRAFPTEFGERGDQVKVQPLSRISLGVGGLDDVKWLIQRLQQAVEYAETHDCGEIAEMKADEQAASTDLRIVVAD